MAPNVYTILPGYQPKSSINNPTLPAGTYEKVYSTQPTQTTQPKTTNYGEISTAYPGRYSGGGGGGGGGVSAGGSGTVQTSTGGVSTAFPEKYSQNRDESGMKAVTQPKSNTIVEQLKAQNYKEINKPRQENRSVVTSVKPLASRQEELSTGYSVIGAAKESTKNVFSFGTIGEKGFGTYWNNVFEPVSNIKASGRTNINPRWRGTEITNDYSIPFDYKDTSKMSTGEFAINTRLRTGESFETVSLPYNVALDYEASKIQKKSQDEFASAFSEGGKFYPEVRSKLNEVQGKIDTGSLGLDEGQKQFDEWFTGFSKEKQTDFLGKAKGEYDIISGRLSSQRKQSEKVITELKESEDYGSKLKFGIEFGAFAATGSSVIGTAVLSAYTLGTASKHFSTGIFGNDLSIKERASEIGTGIFKVGAGLALSNLAIGKSPNSLMARQLNKEYISELERDYFKIGGLEKIRTDKGQAFKVFGERVVSGGTAKQDLDLVVPAFKTGENKFSISGGQGTVRTKIYNFISEETLQSKEDILFGGKGTVQEIKSFKANSPQYKFNQEFDTTEWSLSTGSGYIRVKGKQGFKTFKFAGLGKEEDELYKVIGIKPQNVRNYPAKIESKELLIGKKEIHILDQPKINFANSPKDILGTYYHDENMIVLSNKLKNEDISLVARHETAHAIFKERGFSKLDLSKYNKEISSTSFGKNLLKGGYKKSELADETFARVMELPKTEKTFLDRVGKVKSEAPMFYEDILQKGMKPLSSVKRYKTITKEVEPAFMRIKGKLSSIGTIQKLKVTQQDLGYSTLGGKIKAQTVQRTVTPSFVQEFAQQSGNIALPKIKSTTSTNTISTINVIEKPQQSIYYGTGTYERTEQSQVLIRRFNPTNNRLSFIPISNNFITTREDKGFASKAFNKPSDNLISNLLQPVSNNFRFGELQSPALKQGSGQTLKLRQELSKPSFNPPPSYNPDFGFDFGFRFGFRPNFNLPKLSSSSSKFSRKSRPRTSYSPSLAASIFGIYGKPNKIGKDIYGSIYGGGIRPLPLLGKIKRRKRRR